MNISGEATIVGTSQSSVYTDTLLYDFIVPYPASKLIDGLGLDGNFYKENGCAHTVGSEGTYEWFSLELQVPQIITRVQIADRVVGNGIFTRNLHITIGPSQAYDPNEPQCLPEIPELEHRPGLQDFFCSGALHKGKFVKIARPGGMNICEVKVFTLSGK